MNHFRERYNKLLIEKGSLLFLKKRIGIITGGGESYMEILRRLEIIQFKLEWCDTMATKYAMKEYFTVNPIYKVKYA